MSQEENFTYKPKSYSCIHTLFTEEPKLVELFLILGNYSIYDIIAHRF